MKPIRDQNYYEVLEIPFGATRGEIQRAYELARLTYAKNSIAAYSLFDSSALEEILERIEVAYRTLTNPKKREDYDRTLPGNLGESQPKAAPPVVRKDCDLPAAYLARPELTGKDLKALRETLGLSLPEIAERTRISISYLLYLEEDNLRSLPHETYLRAYLAQYASSLGIVPKQICDRYFAYFRRTRP